MMCDLRNSPVVASGYLFLLFVRALLNRVMKICSIGEILLNNLRVSERIFQLGYSSINISPEKCIKDGYVNYGFLDLIKENRLEENVEIFYNSEIN